MFVQVIEGHTSDPEAVHRQMEIWERDLLPGAVGYLGSAGGCTSSGICVIAVRFENREAAEQNSRRPEQSEWWEATERHFDGPVEFHDTEDVHVMSHGRIADATFVQVMEGHVSDRARADRLEAESDPVLAQHRPDLLGSVTAFHGDGEYTDVAYFTSEADAREAERSGVPAEMVDKFQEWNQMMQVERYLDIREPWLIESPNTPA